MLLSAARDALASVAEPGATSTRVRTSSKPATRSSARSRSLDIDPTTATSGTPIRAHRADFAVAVMTEVDRGHANAIIRARRFQITRAPTHVIAKIAAMP